MRAIIVAAGQGIRIREESGLIPKTLLPYEGHTLLAQIFSNFGEIGVEEFTIVTGFRGHLIAEYLERHDNFGRKVRLVENPEWKGGNGISAACGRVALENAEWAFLSMSDHLVHPEALAAIRDAGSPHNLLLTDDRLRRVFDLDDATKVVLDGPRIVDIGKDLTEYNAVDCGIFRINNRFIHALDAAIAEGKESISDGVRRLITENDMRSVPFPGDRAWVDVDTPEMYRDAMARHEKVRDESKDAPAPPNLGAGAKRL